MNEIAVNYWNEVAKDPDVKSKYICDSIFKDENFIEAIELVNNNWGNVLEIGCGIGRLIVPLADKHKQCDFYGFDISENMIAQAPKRKNIDYTTKGRNLDLVYSILVFQHMSPEDKIKNINLAAKLLKTKGVFYFQFVIGKDNDGVANYQTRVDTMTNACLLAGFKIDSIEQGLMHSQWCFIKATKI